MKREVRTQEELNKAQADGVENIRLMMAEALRESQTGSWDKWERLRKEALTLYDAEAEGSLRNEAL
jgi:hypothetical protein